MVSQWRCASGRNLARAARTASQDCLTRDPSAKGTMEAKWRSLRGEEDNVDAVALGEARGLLQELQGFGHGKIQIFALPFRSRQSRIPCVGCPPPVASNSSGWEPEPENVTPVIGRVRRPHPPRPPFAAPISGERSHSPNLGDSRPDQLFDQRKFVSRGYEFRFILQPVAECVTSTTFTFSPMIVLPSHSRSLLKTLRANVGLTRICSVRLQAGTLI